MIRKLLRESDTLILNIDKFVYASDLTIINNELKILGSKLSKSYNFVKIDISNKEILSKTFQDIDPYFVFHLAAKSHVDKSIERPEIFLRIYVLGTFNFVRIFENILSSYLLKGKKYLDFIILVMMKYLDL